jgi:hypothetical protein
MGVKFFCDHCDKEIFQSISQNMKETETIAEVEMQCICSDCILEIFLKKEEKSVLEKTIANIIKLKFLNYVERFKW